jgi:hypothetical protein
MTAENATAGTTTPTTSTALAAPQGRVPASPGRLGLRGALLLAGAAQLITISALVSADPLAATWSALLLAIAPAPVAATMLLVRPPASRLAVIATGAVLVVGIVGGITHTGLFFLPALISLVVGAVLLSREHA